MLEAHLLSLYLFDGCGAIDRRIFGRTRPPFECFGIKDELDFLNNR